MTDTPDWQRFTNAQGTNLFPAFTQTLPPGLNKGQVIPALSWSSVIISVSVQSGAGQFQIGHFADAAGTQQIDSDTWPVTPTTRLVVRTPLRGTYIRLDYNVTGGGNMAVNNWAGLLAASSDRLSFPVSNQNISQFNHSLAASGTFTTHTGEIAAGLALFYYKPYDTAGKVAVVLHAISELGVPGQLIADFGSPTATVQQLITVPDVIIEAKMINSDAASAHSFDFSLTIPPQ